MFGVSIRTANEKHFQALAIQNEYLIIFLIQNNFKMLGNFLEF